MTNPTPTPDAPAPFYRLHDQRDDAVLCRYSVFCGDVLVLMLNDTDLVSATTVVDALNHYAQHLAALRAERDEAQPVAMTAERLGRLMWNGGSGIGPGLEECEDRARNLIDNAAEYGLVLYTHPPATSPGASRQVGCEDEDGTLIVHSDETTCAVCSERRNRPETATSPGAAGDRVWALIERAHDSVINRIGEPGDYRDRHMLEGIERLKNAIDAALRSDRP